MKKINKYFELKKYPPSPSDTVNFASHQFSTLFKASLFIKNAKYLTHPWKSWTIILSIYVQILVIIVNYSLTNPSKVQISEFEAHYQ